MFDQVRKLLSDNLEIELDSIMPESRLYEDLGVDSIDLFNLIDEFESELGIRIGESNKINTVAQLVSSVEAAPSIRAD